jgi:hypothetical protein
MSTPHRATPEQWEHVEICAGMKQQVPWATAACLLELRARVEALEADQRYQFRSATEKVPTTRLYSYSVGPAKPLDELGQGHTLVSPEPASAEAQPAGLVERVADILHVEAGFRDTGPDGSWDVEARAAIREVAKWLRENDCGYNAIRWLEQEANQ